MTLIRKEERPLVAVALAVFTLLNGLLIAAHYDSFTRGTHVGFWSVFYNHLNMSGYDVFTLIAISCLRVHWNVLRHPLLIAVVLPLYWVNSLIISATGFNAAVFLMAAVTVACDVWGVVLLHRIMRDVMGVSLTDARLLTALFYGFAHVMVACMVPDHFALSLPVLLLVLHRAGMHMREGRHESWLWLSMLWLVSAGLTLTNGVKVMMAAVFVNGRKCVSWRAAAAFAVPAMLLVLVWVWQDRAILQPQERKIKRIERAVAAKDPSRIERLKEHDAWVKRQNGEAIAHSLPLLEWSDVTTPRLRSVTSNLFGESLQLHRDHLLEDVQQTRPVFVDYRWAMCHVVELLMVFFLLAGAVAAWRTRFFKMVMAWVAFDMVMHVGFGFGLNEVYIMTVHWAFVIPLSIASLLNRLRTRPQRMALRCVVSLLALWLWAYNATIVVNYLLGQSM